MRGQSSDNLPEVKKNGKRYVVDPIDGELEIMYGLPANVQYFT